MEKKPNKLTNDISPLRVSANLITNNTNKIPTNLSKEKFVKKISNNFTNISIHNNINNTDLEREREMDKINSQNTIKKKKIILNGKDISTNAANYSFLGRNNKEDNSQIR